MMIRTMLDNGLRVTIAAGMFALAAVAGAAAKTTVYTNGVILTMNDAMPQTEAVAVKDGRILAVGAKRTVLTKAGANAEIIDLDGRTLMPGFIDSHSHVSLTGGKLAFANMSPRPAGPIASIEDIKAEFRRWLKQHPPKPGEPLVGMGYDHSQLKEHRHPTRHDLDAISRTIPIVLIHFSGHQAVLNSRALEMVGYDANTPDPEGGRILREKDGKTPNGIVQETAWIPIKLKVFAATYAQKKERLEKALDLYMANGFTTALDVAITDQEMIDAYRHLGRDGDLKIDIVGMPYEKFADTLLANYEKDRHYHDHFRLAGVKLVLDGGSPGRSAFLREPYYRQMPGEKNFRGVAFFPNQADIDDKVSHYYAKGWQVFIHALGDAAVDQALHAVEVAERKYPGKDRRTQLIHLQLFHPAQMDKARALGATATFQTTHVFYFGDFHRQETFGHERAEKICPARTAWNKGLSVTIHHDSPIHPPDQLMLIWIAVNRQTRSGRVLGPDERLTVMQALKASTINAAYQLFEEKAKGTIEPGKLADFVVLSDNPLTVDPQKIKDIKVLETIKEGRTVYRRP